MSRTLTFLSVVHFFLSGCSDPSVPDSKDTASRAQKRNSIFERKDLRVESTSSDLSLIISQHSVSGDMVTEEIEIPKRRIVLSSTTQLHYFKSLRSLRSVVGCPWLSFVKDEEVKDLLAEGAMRDVTQGAGVGLEEVLACRPDLFLYDPREAGIVPRLREAGIDCVPFFEYMDTSPVERASWITVVGAFIGKRELAHEVIEEIHSKYMAQLNQENDSDSLKLKVLFGSFYLGKWSVAEGGSLIATLVKDAGADYIIDGDGSGSRELDLEEFLSISSGIDALGMIHHGEMSWESFYSLDDRLKGMIPDSMEIVYCNTETRDYFGQGIMEPHMILMDLKAEFRDWVSREKSYFQRLR